MTPERMAYWLIKSINQAVRDFEMIQPGDRVAVAVSGGKDSLSLLRLLDERRRTSQEEYQLKAIHVLGDAGGPQSEGHAPLLAWLEASGLPYQAVPMLVKPDEKIPLGCQRCTWNRRRTLFETAHAMGCNVVAFGHHADDLAQTTLLNLLYHGVVETMIPRRDYFGGAIRLIRPLCYASEKDIRRFAKACGFPPPPPLCPRSDHTQRKHVAELIRLAEDKHQNVRANLLRVGLKYTRPLERPEDHNPSD